MSVIDFEAAKAAMRRLPKPAVAGDGLGRLDVLLSYDQAVDGLRAATAALQRGRFQNIVTAIGALSLADLPLLARACAGGAGDPVVIDTETLTWRRGDASGRDIASALAAASGLSQETACQLACLFIGHGLLSSLFDAKIALISADGSLP